MSSCSQATVTLICQRLNLGRSLELELEFGSGYALELEMKLKLELELGLGLALGLHCSLFCGGDEPLTARGDR